MSNVVDELKYLDNILEYLKSCPKNSACIEAVFYNIYKEDLTDDSPSIADVNSDSEGFLHIDYTISKKYKLNKLQNALSYLHKYNLIESKSNQYSLTFDGLIKTTNNFVTTFEKDKVENDLRKKHLTTSIELSRMQKWTIWIAVTFSAIAIMVSVFSFFKKSGNTNYYRSYPIKKHKPNPKILRGYVIEIK